MSAPGSANTGVLLAAPRRLGRYEIVAKIASGGMATVYIGRATGVGGFQRLVAIKCCHAHLRDDPEFRAMFLDEARLAACIHHPNVVPTLDVQDGRELFLVMEYIEGGRVSELAMEAFEQGAFVPIDVAMRVFCDALAGLHAAHTQVGPDGAALSIVHRDVSPQNLLVGVDGITRVVDFGVAKAEARATITADERIKGKLGYMSPEQIGRAGVSQRSDLFATGVVLWEVLAGRRLFAGDNQADVIQQVMFLPIERPSKHRLDVPAALEAIVTRALSREPDARYASALEMATALETCGVRIASHRQVGEYVGATLGRRLEARRAMLRSAPEAVAAGADHPADVLTADALSGVVATRGGGSSTPRTAHGSRRRTATVVVVLGALAIVAAVVIAAAMGAWTSGSSTRTSPRPAADRTPASGTSAARAAEPTEPTTLPAPAAPTVAPSDESDRPRRRTHERRRRRRARGGAQQTKEYRPPHI